MSQPINFRRGTTSQRQAVTLGNGEPGWDESTKRLYVGDGTTPGGLFIGGAAATSDFTIHVATTALGGRTAAAGASGLSLKDSTNTGLVANKLVDAAGGFTSAYLNKTVYNKSEDKWAKITAIDSSSQVSLSADIFTASGRQYAIADALDNVADAITAVPAPFSVNVTVRVSPGTFSGAVAFVGKLPAGNKTLTWQGNTITATTISGQADVAQQTLTIGNITFTGGFNANYGANITWSNCPLQSIVKTNTGSSLTWDTCTTSGAGKLFVYAGSSNIIKNSTVTVGNDPQGITAINSTINTGYTLYVASAALGGSDSVGDGLPMASGTTNGVTALKLIDTAANFTSALVNKPVYNSTDDTWAKITAVDSATQLSIDADIFVSGEAYVIPNAVATIAGVWSKIPGLVNSNTSVKVSNGTFGGDFILQGKAYSGPYSITITGTLTLLDSLTAAASTQGSGATQGTAVRNAGTWTASQRQHKLVKFTSGNNSGITRLIDDNDATTLTIVDRWPNTIAVGNTFVVQDWATIIQCSAAQSKVVGQTSLYLENLHLSPPASPAWPVELFGNSSLTLTRCWLDKALASQEPNTIYSYDTIVLGSGVADAGIFLQQSSFYGYRSKVYKCGYLLRALASAYIQLRDGFIADGFSTATCTYGVWVDRNAVGRFDPAGVEGYVRIKNCTTGLYAQRGGMAINTVNIQWLGNTTNKAADAASYGYTD